MRWLLLLLCLCFTSLPLFSQLSSVQSTSAIANEVKITCLGHVTITDSSGVKYVTFHGNAELTTGVYQVSADRIWYPENSTMIYAEGNVVVSFNGQSMNGKGIELNRQSPSEAAITFDSP